jgi:hypothetical protein
VILCSELSLVDARGLENAEDRAAVLAAIAGLLPQRDKSGVVQEALRSILISPNLGAHLDILVQLVGHLPEVDRESVLRSGVEATKKLVDKEKRLAALRQLAALLHPPLLRESLVLASSIRDHNSRMLALAELAMRYPESQRSAVLMEALRAAAEIGNEVERADGLATVANYMGTDEALLGATLSVTRTLGSDYSRARAFAGHALQLDVSLLDPLLDQVSEITSYKSFSTGRGLGARLPDSLHHEALTIISAIKEEAALVHALTGLTPRLSADLLKRVFETIGRLTKKRRAFML